MASLLPAVFVIFVWSVYFVICCKKNMLPHFRRLSFDPASRDFAAHLKRRSSQIVWVAIQMGLPWGTAFAPPESGGHHVYTALLHPSKLEAMALLIRRMWQARAFFSPGTELGGRPA